ncbi:MAG: flavodoxin [Candidatus Brocadiia bacterium]|nr:flavodoxin [Candidatus Brocadiia bacterium]
MADETSPGAAAERKTLVVYYSRTGNTRKVAEAIQEALGCDMEEIIDRKDRGGVLGYVVGAIEAALKKCTEIGEVRMDPGAYDLVVIGSPVWSTAPPAIRTYINRYRDSLNDVAFFLTAIGVGVGRTSRSMAKFCGKEPAAELLLKAGVIRKGDWRRQVQEFAEKLRK